MSVLFLESPTILIIVGLPALIILGMILPIFAIREGYYAGGTVVMLIFLWNRRLADRLCIILESCHNS